MYQRLGSLTFPILKKNGDIRIVVDYRLLNGIKLEDPFPNPGIEELFSNLSGSKFFSSIDLERGYHQIKVAETDIYKTAFTILGIHFECIRMPFDLKNVPKTFQRGRF